MKTLKTEQLYQGKFLSVEKRTLENNQVREVVTMKDAVACIVTNKEKTKLIMVKQYREPAKQECWEIPAGMLDVDGESPENAMLRELEEEAHLKLNSATKFITYFANIGSCTHQVSIYETSVSNDCNFDEEVITDDNDVTEKKWFSLEELKVMIDNNEIIDGKTIISILKLLGNL